MISSLNIKGVATYDPINGVPISELKKVNFFFGFNGSGKSTIANYLRNLSLDPSLQNAYFSQCSNVGYNSANHQLLIFNEDFIEENFKRNQELKGVFTLNQSNATIDQQITDEENNIASYELIKRKYQSKIEALERDKNSKGNTLLNNCWNERASFATLSKISLAHSGSKPNFLLEIRNSIPAPSTQIPTLQSLTDTYQSLYERDLKNVNANINGKSYLVIRRIEIQLEILLQEIIVGNEEVDIAGLINSLNSRSWVELGLTYLEKSGDVCPFCQNQTIDENLKEQFNKFFDETYKRKVGLIENLKQSYRQKADEFIAEVTSIQNVFNPDNLVSNIIIALNQHFNRAIEIIEDKLTHTNERRSITSISTLKSELSEIIKAIKDNNQLYDDSATNKEKLLENIWLYIADKCQQTISEYDQRVIQYVRLNSLAVHLRDKYAAQISTAKQKIETLRGQTVNTKDAVDKINLILRNSGFEGFEIDEKEKTNNISRYYLKRPNTVSTTSVFQTLSEGEKNFIAFLYFYQSCLGTDDLLNNGSKKKIIVIDDPVSSLDSQSMFIVSTLIHSLILRKANDNRPNRMLLKNNDIAQVFVLTHNFYFYKEVSFNKRPLCTDWWHYRIIKVNNQTKISGGYDKTINDDYTLLWNSIKELKNNLPHNSTQNVLIANSMRRIIESYVSFIGYGNDSWAALLNDSIADPAYYIKSSFISTINDESHKVAALDSIYYQKIINEQPQVLFDVFKSIFKSIGKEHYEMMMGETIPA
jgi:wobble nucleotide-excising tRNase